MGSGGMFKRLQPINWKRESTVTDRYIDGEWEFSTKHSSEGVITLENLPIKNLYLKNEQIHLIKQQWPFTKSAVTVSILLFLITFNLSKPEVTCIIHKSAQLSK